MFGKSTRNEAPVPADEPQEAPMEVTETPEPVEPQEAPVEPDELAQVRAQVDNLGRQLFRARVEQTGLLIDPEDMPYDAALVDDPDALSAAVNDLVEHKPHLRTVATGGDLPAFGGGADPSAVSLTGLLRNNA